MSYTHACEQSGVARTTVRKWLLKGTDPETRSAYACPVDYVNEPYWTFARELRKAQAEGQAFDKPVKPANKPPQPITDEQQTALLGCLAIGSTFRTACDVAGVPLPRLLSWLRRGGYPRQLTNKVAIDPVYIIEPYATFVQHVLDAESYAFARTD